MLRAHSIEIIGQVIAVLVLGFPIRPQAEEVDTIEANIEAAELAAEAEADDWFQDIRRRRSGLREWLGLESAATYHSVALGSVPGEELAGAGGDFTLQGIWTPSHHWTENPLALHSGFVTAMPMESWRPRNWVARTVRFGDLLMDSVTRVLRYLISISSIVSPGTV